MFVADRDRMPPSASERSPHDRAYTSSHAPPATSHDRSVSHSHTTLISTCSRVYSRYEDSVRDGRENREARDPYTRSSGGAAAGSAPDYDAYQRAKDGKYNWKDYTSITKYSLFDCSGY